jgi:hypothetical protein
LGETARILQCRRGRLYPLHWDVVAQGVQEEFDVSLDARAEELRDPRVAPQFGNVILQRTLNASRHRRQPVVQPVGGFGDVVAHVHLFVGTRTTHFLTVDPAVPEGWEIRTAKALSRGRLTNESR